MCTLHLLRQCTILTAGSRYLSNVERRVRDLESLFSRLLPDVDLEHALGSSTDVSATDRTPPAVSQPPFVQLTKRPSEIDDGLDTVPDTAPSGAEGYDWTEDTSLDYLADGMAALRIEPTGAGYLGGSFAAIPSTKSELSLQVRHPALHSYGLSSFG